MTQKFLSLNAQFTFYNTFQCAHKSILNATKYKKGIMVAIECMALVFNFFLLLLNSLCPKKRVKKEYFRLVLKQKLFSHVAGDIFQGNSSTHKKCKRIDFFILLAALKIYIEKSLSSSLKELNVKLYKIKKNEIKISEGR